MTREEAIPIAHSSPEVIVEVLLKLSARIDELERKIALLTRGSSNSSKPPSSDGPGTTLRPRRPKKSKKRYCTSADPDVAKTAKSLLKHWHSLFTFLEYEGVEPTNNAAERGLRPAVIWRKISFGNQSDDGELLTAN